MPESSDFADRVKALCKREKYESVLRNIVEADRLYETDPFGWQFCDIQGLSGAHVNVLLQEKIIDYGYKSQSATHFRCLNRSDLEKVLDGFKAEREERERQVSLERKILSVTLSPELVQKFEGLLSSNADIIEYWSRWINPKIEGMEAVKKAILISVASHGDKFGDRGRVHVLVYGDPGGAKSQLLSWVVYQIGAKFCSQRTSKVGLTGDASGEEFEPGALPKAHRGILCIDELDKFDNKDRQGLLEAMEEGKIPIDVGKFSLILDAEARIIAGANRIDNFSPELLDRFDFKFEVKASGGEQEKRITCCIVDHWFETKRGYDGFDLRNYLRWIGSFEPQMPKHVREKAKQLLCMYLDLDEGIRGSPRRKEAIMRVAYTIAKLHRRNVEVNDIITAIKLLNPNINSGKLQALEYLAKQWAEKS